MLLKQSKRERGSVMVLVVVATVLLAILGISYVQVVRAQRADLPRAVGDIAAVRDAIIYQILSAATRDVMDKDGVFFNQGSNIEDGIETGYDEPYDYPWTNPNVPGWRVVRTPLGNELQVYPGIFDDMWLSSTAPIADNTADNSTQRWEHITNLNGYWLILPDPINGTEPLPLEVPARVTGNGEFLGTNIYIDDVSNRGLATRYNNSSAWLPYGVDATGNGILDSRWTWAPLPRVNGIAYVMAVRIVDLSAKANAAVALSMIDNAGNYDPNLNAPRWWFPSELDLGGQVFDIADAVAGISSGGSFPNTTVAMNELRSLLVYRGLTNASITPWGASPFGSPGQRGHFWVHGASMYGNPSSPYGSIDALKLSVADELALRWREGLKRPDSDSSNIEQQMPGFLRNAPAQPELAWYQAMENMGINPAYRSYYNYHRYEPRNQFTVLSGASIYAPRLPNLAGGVHNDQPIENDRRRVLKEDVNRLTMLELSMEIRKVIERGTFTMPLGVRTYLTRLGIDPDSAEGREFFANQMAVNIHDYGDEDNLIRVFEPVTGQRRYYGMEALPFIAEVYVQRRYQATATPVNPPTVPPTFTVRWDAVGDAGYAIEIRNPFRRPISLKNVYLYIGGSRVRTSTENPDAPDDLAVISGRNELGVDEVLVLYRDSNNGTEDDDEIDSLIVNAGNVIRVNLASRNVPFDWPTTGPVDVELRAKETLPDGTSDPGAIFDWAYCAVEAEEMPETFDHPGPVVEPDPSGAFGYRQRSYHGNGRGLNVLTVAPGEFNVHSADPNPHPADPNQLRDETLDKLGDEDKNGPADRVNPETDQIIIADRGEFAGGSVGPIVHIGELLQIAVIGPLDIGGNQASTIADAWGNANGADRFMFDAGRNNSDDWVDPTAHDTDLSDPNYAPNLRINHALFLLERLTTMSPFDDNEDNDGDGRIDNDEETFIPGVINLNTVPYDTLVRVLPIPDQILRERVARRIVDYRDRTTRDPRQPWRDTDPSRKSLGGIAYVTELWEEIVPLLRDDAPYAGTDVSTIGGVRVDFTANPSNSTNDDIRGDREQEILLLNWLLQTCTTRSDRFVAYVLIHGYPVGDFRNGGEGPVESMRFFFVFDRSNLVDENSFAQELGRLEVK